MMNTVHTSFKSSSSLDQSIVIMRQLVLWLIRSGVGYTDFAAALKPIFFEQALNESERIGGKKTDSAISLLSGLHRRDVSALRDAHNGTAPLPESLRNTATSVPAQVIGRWLVNNWPDTIPFSGESSSFEALVRCISNDRHPKSIAQELERLGVVTINKKEVHLQKRAFVPDANASEAHELLANGVADHLAAGVHNLTSGSDRKFLEQSVFADGLTAESVSVLERMSNQAWYDTMNSVLKQAIELCKQDESNDAGNQRFRLGMFAYAEPEYPQEPMLKSKNGTGEDK